MMTLLKKKGFQYIVISIFAILFIATVVWLNQPASGAVPTAASKVSFYKGHVTQIMSDTGVSEPWTEGLRLGTQDVFIQIDSGDHKGISLPTTNYMSAYSNIDLKVNSKVIVRIDRDDAGSPYISSIVSHNRMAMLGTLVVLFVASLLVFGGKKGAMALVGLVFTVFSIWFFLIPMIQRGVPAILAAILLVAITTLVSLVALNGFSKKTWISVIGCVGGVTIAGFVALLAGAITPINGFNMPEAEDLILRVGDGSLKVSGLMVSGILIAALGAVMDVSLTIASAVGELSEMNSKATRVDLFKSGLNIGRDTMGTMANTLILAFAGASLNMLILFRIFDYPTLQIFNSDMMALEIIQSLAGSIGIIMTVPLVALLSATAFGHSKSALMHQKK